MSGIALLFTLAFVGVTMLISVWQKLGLERDIAVGTVRSALQLLLVGYVLQYVFGMQHPALILLIVAVMIGVASWNAGQRTKGLPGIRRRIALSLAATELLTVGLLTGLGIIEPTPQYLIPLSGITIGSAMIVSGLYLNQMRRELESSRGEIEALMALGATEKQALQDALKRSVRSSMIPTVDGMKTVGLVQLPGMMTGMIVAGADPVEAVRYQILIMFVLASSAAVTSMLLSHASYKLWFDREGRLRRNL
ncbi:MULTISPECIES: ABC transporter permease [Paenibacillus]|uniref:ABC transporter permease n=1 Tax=Paenibacillus TaxID=44249 RepID=UPI0022B8EEE4|nr:iron export ABC transporter permease subunit FetB [Paenibacillus caseinilyticus]MCZ8518140.1 iron export ABC transporter permease subunit FetB [Paenibacillus caseinilyticus]